MWLLGSIFIITSLLVLYLKYRVVFTGEKCKGKIIDIVEQNAGYSVGGVNVKKHAYIVKIKNKKYYTAHGCFFLSLGKRKVGKEISVFKLDIDIDLTKQLYRSCKGDFVWVEKK